MVAPYMGLPRICGSEQDHRVHYGKIPMCKCMHVFKPTLLEGQSLNLSC